MRGVVPSRRTVFEMRGPVRRAEALANLRFESTQLRVIRRHGREASERFACANEVAELTPRDRPGLREEVRRVPVAAALRCRFLGEGGHARPVPRLFAINICEELEGALVLGVEPHGLLEPLRAEVGVLVTCRPARPKHEREARLRRARRHRPEDLGLAGIERGHRARFNEQTFVQPCDLLRERIGGVCLPEHPLGLGGGEALDDARGAQEKATTPRAHLLVRRPQETRDVLLPGTVGGLNVGHATGSLGARPVTRREGSGVRRPRALVVSGIAQHIAELEKERRRARPLLRRLQLELDELLHHIQLAEIPVNPARRFQALDERRVELVGVLEVLERLHAGEELGLEHVPELQVVGGLCGVRLARLDALLELLDEPLPIADVLEMRKPFLQIHGFPRLRQPVSFDRKASPEPGEALRPS